MVITILITGATGKVGSNVIKSLVQRAPKDTQIIAAVRDVNSDASKKLGVSLREFDYNKPDLIKAALEGVVRLFIATPPEGQQAARTKLLVDQAKESNVKHVVRLSGDLKGIEGHIADDARLAERHVEASGIPYTMIQPVFFFDNVYTKAPSIKTQGTIYSASGDAKYHMIDTEDIGKAAATILTAANIDVHNGKHYVLSGNDYLSWAQVAELISTITHKPVKHAALTHEAYIALLTQFGVPAPVATALSELDVGVTKLPEAPRSTAFEEITGEQPKTLKSWLEEKAGAFQQ
eukprot:TRINITY_DN11409_c0_g1_i5.p1 TRINITY_DN11409_c0_g1~~TRINITY_DN11409_c0_g1_i5.p1  ORF type:complete len:292 (+),score=88.74 TRINITY_DN11409_c0_g1_i5:100-975(+)